MRSVVVLFLLVFTSCQSISRLDEDRSDNIQTEKSPADAHQPGSEQEPGSHIAYTLPDGYILNIRVVWDGRSRKVYSEDGFFLVMNPEGYYEYTFTDDQGLPQPSGIIARNPEDRTANEILLLERHGQ